MPKIALLALTLGSFAALLAAQTAPANNCTQVSWNPGLTGNNAAAAPATTTALTRNLVPCPTTTRLHFDRYLHSQFNWSTPLTPLLTVVPSQTATTHGGYPGGWDGFGDHYRVEIEEEGIGKSLRHFFLPVIFHQDENYQPLGDGDPLETRVGHVLRHLFFTESDNHSQEVFNMEAIPASLISAVVVNYTCEPGSERGAGGMVGNFLWGVAWRLGGDALDEFSPEIHRLLP